MLSCADARLVARDPAVTGLPLLLDDAALTELLGAPVRRRYLRYKPGTACVLGLDVAGERAFAVAYAADAAGKLAKTLDQAPVRGVLVFDERRGVLVGRPPADRDLPALAPLAEDLPGALSRVLPDRDLTGARLRLLSHKPQRRWVGLLTTDAGPPVVLRAHRPARAAATVAAVRRLDAGAPWTPTLLGTDPSTGLTALTWLPGEGLDHLLAAGSATVDQLARAGTAVADLHRRPTTGMPVRTGGDDVAALHRAAAAVGVLQPAHRETASRLANAIAGALTGARVEPVLVHGDLSADQVVVGDDGRTGLVDLDDATAGDRALDLGSTVAALHLAAVVGRGPADVEPTVAALLSGYGAVDEHRLQAQTAAGLLRRAVEPFRLCSPDWPEQLSVLLELAAAHCPAGVRA